MQQQLMTIKQLATYLNVNERTVLKLAQEGALPGVKVGNQWRFRRAMIDTWLDDQMLGITPRWVDPVRSGPQRMLTLESCFNGAHVHPELAARDKTGAIVELSALARELELIRDENWFVGALIKRENVMPSGMGNGIAFLHTLRRHPEHVTRPFMLLGRSQEGIDFGATDGVPAHLLFVLGLRYDELHLPWLSKLVQMLAQPETLPSLLDAPDANVIYDLLREAEQRVGPVLVPESVSPKNDENA